MHHSRNGFLTAKGLAEAAQQIRPAEYTLLLDGHEPACDIDSMGSVSALTVDGDPSVWPPEWLIERQAERHLNGS